MDTDTLARLEARVRFLTRYAAVSTVAFVLLGTGAFVDTTGTVVRRIPQS